MPTRKRWETLGERDALGQVSYDDRVLVRNGSEPDRRSAVRYPIRFELRYAQPGGQDEVQVKGVGHSVNISSRGVLFSSALTLEEGSTIELVIPWAAPGRQGLAVELYLAARIVRSESGQTAAWIARHEFRTVLKDRGHKEYLINRRAVRESHGVLPENVGAAGGLAKKT